MVDDAMSKSMRTFVLWLVLMVLFVAFYKVVGGAAPAQTPRAPDESSFWQPMMTQFLPMLALFIVFFVFVRRAQGKNVSNHEGVVLLSQGRYAEALEKFDQFRSARPRNPVGVFNVGAAKLSLWKLESALVDLRASEKLAARKEPTLATLLPEHLALTLALLGDGIGARQSLSALPVGKGDPGRVALAEAIVLARSSEASEARRKLGSFEAKQVGGNIGALARAVRGRHRARPLHISVPSCAPGSCSPACSFRPAGAPRWRRRPAASATPPAFARSMRWPVRRPTSAASSKEASAGTTRRSRRGAPGRAPAPSTE